MGTLPISDCLNVKFDLAKNMDSPGGGRLIGAHSESGRLSRLGLCV